MELSPDNIYFEPCGPCGSRYTVGSEDYGFIGIFDTEAEVCEAVRTWADEAGWFPELYFISDHGNISDSPTTY